MGTIAQELNNFKNALNGKTDEMDSVCSDLETKIKEFSKSSSLYKSQFGSYYQSENKELILSAFDCMSKIYSKIESSVSDTLRPLITNSKSIVSNVGKLEEINGEIEVQKKIISDNPGSDIDSVSKRNTANGVISSKNIEFNKIHNESLDMLSKLKRMDKAIVIEELTNKDTNNNDIVVEGGTLTQKSFVSSKGVQVNYFIYVPNVKDSSTKLPILTYFHGVQDTIEKNRNNNFKYGGGLAGLIETKQLSPKGIVIFPQATGNTRDPDFVTKQYGEAVIELIKETASKYNGDVNRVSVAGHSNGGAAVLHIVNNFPGFFAAAAPICCPGNAKEGIMRTNLYAFAGGNDKQSNQGCIGMVGHVIKNGNIGLAKTYAGRGHEIQTLVFQDDQVDENGNKVKLIDWLMSKTTA